MNAIGSAAADFSRHVRRLVRRFYCGLPSGGKAILYSTVSALIVAFVMAILRSWVWTLAALGGVVALLIVSWILSHTIW